MEIDFDCSCGERIEEFTRGDGGDVPGVRVACGDCDARYIVTITQITQGVQ